MCSDRGCYSFILCSMNAEQQGSEYSLAPHSPKASVSNFLYFVYEGLCISVSSFPSPMRMEHCFYLHITNNGFSVSRRQCYGLGTCDAVELKGFDDMYYLFYLGWLSLISVAFFFYCSLYSDFNLYHCLISPITIKIPFYISLVTLTN